MAASKLVSISEPRIRQINPYSHKHRMVVAGFLMEVKTPIKPTTGESKQNTYA